MTSESDYGNITMRLSNGFYTHISSILELRKKIISKAYI